MSLRLTEPGDELSLSLAATIATGREWPDGSECEQQGKILILSSEDPSEQAIGPRLVAAGVPDGMALRVRSMTNDAGEKRTFDLKMDLARLPVKGVQLLIVDSLGSYLGNVDSHKSASVRNVLTPLVEWAEEHGVTIIGIMHWNKGNSTKALNKTNGSTAFNGVARAVFRVMKDPEYSIHHRFFCRPKTITHRVTCKALAAKSRSSSIAPRRKLCRPHVWCGGMC